MDKYTTCQVRMPVDLLNWLKSFGETKNVTTSEITIHALNCLKRHIEQPIINAVQK
jgi:hypothetical protein